MARKRRREPPTLEELRERYVTVLHVPLQPQDIEACHGGTVWNKHTGEAHLTLHALERFNQRIRDEFSPPPGIVPIDLLQRFRESFARAEPEEINPIERTKRIISNNFERAQYFLDKIGMARFIILEKKKVEKLVIVTVERPK